jgi:mRNA interferase MazF
MPRGDIVLVNLPVSSGHEQSGQRPALIVHSDQSHGLMMVMLIPMTSNLAAKRFDHTIVVQPSSLNGLSQPSILMVFQLRALDRSRLLRTIGRLESEIMDLVDSEMKNLLGI